MGMYTELFISCRIEDKAPKNVIAVLDHLFGKSWEETPTNLPEHDFFKCERWNMIGRCSSYSFVPESLSKFWKDKHNNGYYLTSRSDLKNYDGEIDKFIDWITPYIDELSGQFFAYSRYEEDDEPRLYFIPKEGEATQ